MLLKNRKIFCEYLTIIYKCQIKFMIYIIFLITVFGSRLMREYKYSLLLTCRIATVNFFTITLNDRWLTMPSWVLNTYALLVVDGSGTCSIEQYASLQVKSSCYITSHMSYSCPCPDLTNSGDCVVHTQSYQRSTM